MVKRHLEISVRLYQSYRLITVTSCMHANKHCIRSLMTFWYPCQLRGLIPIAQSPWVETHRDCGQLMEFSCDLQYHNNFTISFVRILAQFGGKMYCILARAMSPCILRSLLTLKSCSRKTLTPIKGEKVLTLVDAKLVSFLMDFSWRKLTSPFH